MCLKLYTNLQDFWKTATRFFTIGVPWPEGPGIPGETQQKVKVYRAHTFCPREILVAFSG